MKTKSFQFFQKIININSGLEQNLSSYEGVLKEINQLQLDQLTAEELKAKSEELKQRALGGATLESLLAEAYALVKEACYRVLGLKLYEVQLRAAIAMHQGKVVEMQTGEGKTVTAVLPAYLNALTGKGVHVLTFNDYLAKRDAEWMGSIYEFLGLRVGAVKEGLSLPERQQAYAADVTYVTAKEAGFDYLRDFLCTEKQQCVHRAFHYAIIDEADSILIDEARIPLVIAGNMQEDVEQVGHLRALVKKLVAHRDYELDAYGTSIFLTDAGLLKAESILKCSNLYEAQNLELLARLNCALQAEVLLKKDRDYILREGRVELVDEFTGRIADKRHWPDKLQAAVEAKEGVLASSKGVVMGSIALQHFISLYEKLAGMTGTAKLAANELREYYNLEVTAIPTNKPCIRRDYEDLIFKDKAAKLRAVVEEVKRVHSDMQPVLIGTSTVEESEQLSAVLKGNGISCRVLNAKNDEEEAEVIAQAGTAGAVTVSTNMAGRGVDIKLGEGVAALGGLYIIGTNRHESRRIDDQLRGRAGRQGDPGQSRFFISLEDEWVKKYEVLKADAEALDMDELRTLISRGQRLVEGYLSDMRVQQWKYSFISEQQRRIIHKWRQDILTNKQEPTLLKNKCPEIYQALEVKYGKELLRKAEQQLTLYFINKHYAEHLDYISYIKESIHLVAIGKGNPLFEFNKQAVEAFEQLVANIEEDIVEKLMVAEITANGIDLEKQGLMLPTSTYTYLMDDNPEQFSNLPALLQAISSVVKGPLFTVRSLYKTAGNFIKRLNNERI